MREVKVIKRIKVVKVKAQADKVPRGIDFPGSLSSPDRLAPAIIPKNTI